MASRAVINAVPFWNNLLRGLAALGLLSSAFFLPQSQAKEPSLVAIELYDGASGAAYIQIGGVLLNGKIEVRECAPGQGASIDKSAYGKMARLNLAVGGVLERADDGVLRYTSSGAQPICVLPVNIKFEHGSAAPLATLAEQAEIKGSPMGPGSDGATGIPAFKRGVKLVFVAAANVEYAEFLRAQRASTIADWQTYLGKYPSTAHTGDARQSLALLFVQAGEKSVTAYDKSANTDSPSWADLKQAKSYADQARALMPALDSAAKLVEKIRADLITATLTARGELNAYRDALSSHSKGYAHLLSAQKLTDAVNSVDPQFQPGLDLLAEVGNATRAFDKALKAAEDAVAKKDMDSAILAVAPYRSFVTEEPRTTAVLDAVYDFHMDLGSKAGLAQDWPAAVTEYEKADAAKDTLEVQDALKNAREQKTAGLNSAAARAAEARSATYEQEHDIIQAYETLAALPEAQQKLVAEAMDRLKAPYVQAAVQKAKLLRQVHGKIGGIDDGYEMENAYAYLKKANDLIPDPAYSELMISTADQISAFFLAQADHYLAKPEGSGTEVAWAYLQEALLYKASNQIDIRDRKTAALKAHSMHSTLSIRVQFRDGTSQRDSEGYATQLANDIITDLEAPSVGIRAIHEAEINGVKPDFQLVGDVTQHHITDTPTLQSLQSTYYVNSQMESNEAWIKANRKIDEMNQDLATAKTAQTIALTKGNKKNIELANKKVAEIEKQISSARVQLDSIPRENRIEIIQPYNYIKKTIDYNEEVELQYRLDETLGSKRSATVPVVKSDHKQVVILEGVKAEDRSNVKATGTIPDKNELLHELEAEAKVELIAKVLKSVASLPQTIYDGAKRQEDDNDLDGAAEGYLRYLNCAPREQADQIQHARKFLSDRFHLRPDIAVTP